MKKIFTIIIAATMAVSAWAGDTNYSPTAEYNVRPTSDGTAWTKSPTDGSAASIATFECTASACFYAIQQYKVSDIQCATSLTLTLTNGSGSDALAIWAFKGTFATDMEASAFNTAFENTTGVKPGNSGTHTATYLLKDIANAKNPNSTFNITGTPLDTLKKLAGADGSFTLLITNKTADLDAKGTTKRTYLSSNSTNDESNRPVLTVTTVDPVVTNITTGIGYSDLTSALNKAVADDELQLNEDVTVTSRIENSVAITIQGKTGSEKILRGTGLDNIVFVTKNAALTLKNLIIDGQGTERSKAAVEASNYAVTMSNVTIQNFAGTSQRVLQVKKSCTVENCTFKDNTVAAGYGDIYVGASNCLTLKGSNTIGNGIYVEKALYFNDDETSHTTPITVIADATRESNNGLGSNKAFIKGTTDTYKYTLSGNASWDIAGNESQNYIYVTKAASVTKTTDKDMSAGGGYNLGTVTIE